METPFYQRNPGHVAGLGAETTAEAPERNFAPSRSATIAAGATEEVTFRGQSGAPFGIDHLTVGGDYDGLLVSADTENGERGIFNKVHLSTLRTLFLRRRLKGLIQLKENTRLRLIIENPTAAQASVNVQLTGYSGTASIEEQKRCLRQSAGTEKAPVPKLAVSRGSVPAGATDHEIDLPGRPYEISFKRFLIGSDQNLSDLQVSLKLYSNIVYEQVYATQLVDAFDSLELTRPFVVEPTVPLKLAVTNNSGAAADVTALFEAYRQG